MSASAIRYLWVTSPHFRHAGVLVFGLTLFAGWVLHLQPLDVGAPYLPLLFGQLFAASSGFRQAAEAGHLDALLVSGAGRRRMALAHWTLSAGPGLGAWVGVAVVETWVLGERAVGSSIVGLLSVFLVSTVAWGATLPTTRFAGGALWLFTMGAIALFPDGIRWFGAGLTTPPGEEIWTALRAVLPLLVCPFLLLAPGAEWVAGRPVASLALAAVGWAFLAIGIHWVATREFRGVA
jgi:hypothetical protein